MSRCVDYPATPIVPPPSPAPSGGSLPSGGAKGQVLTKASGADGDAVWANAGGVIIDPALSPTSTNPVANRAINSALVGKADASEITRLEGEIATKADTTALNGKVDKETGKGLSTNDYTNADKQKLGGLAHIKSVGSGLNLSSAGVLTADGGSAGSVEWDDVLNKPDNLATTDDVDAKVFIAEYGVATAQDIIAFLDSTDPKAPMAVKRGNDYYTVITTSKQAENKVIIRTFATLSGVFYIFTYTITDGTWANGNYGIQKALVSGTDIKTVNGESVLGSGDVKVGGVEVTSGDSFSATIKQDTDAVKLTKKSDDAVSLDVSKGAVTDSVDLSTFPSYVTGAADTVGNCVAIGDIVYNNEPKTLYQFFFETDALPNTTAKAYDLTNSIGNYTIDTFVDATGMTTDGIFIGNGRTDNDNRVVVQQFSKNNKTVTIRAYQDFSSKTAFLKIIFIGSKNS